MISYSSGFHPKNIYKWCNISYRENQDADNWQDISEWLEEAGYKNAFMQNNLNIPETVDVLVKMVGFNIKNNKMIIDLNVWIVSSLENKKLQAFLEKPPDDSNDT